MFLLLRALADRRQLFKFDRVLAGRSDEKHLSPPVTSYVRLSTAFQPLQ